MNEINSISKLIKDNMHEMILSNMDDYATKDFYQERREDYFGHGAGSMTDIYTSSERSYARVGIKSGIVGP